jgi:hypothetical protein
MALPLYITSDDGLPPETLLEIYQPILKYYPNRLIVRKPEGDIITIFDEDNKQPIYKFTISDYKTFKYTSPYTVTTYKKITKP